MSSIATDTRVSVTSRTHVYPRVVLTVLKSVYSSVRLSIP